MRVALRSRVVIIAGVLLLLVAAATAFLPQAVRATEFDRLDSALAAAVPAVEHLSSAEGASALASPASGLSGVYAATQSADGSWTVLAVPLTAQTSRPEVPSIATPSGQQVNPETVGSATGDVEWRAVLVDSAGTRILVAIPIDAFPGSDRWLGVILAAGRIVLLVMVALAGWWLLRLGTRQIREVTRVVNAISSGDRTTRLAVPPSGTDAARLALAFNEMLDQQHAAEDRLRRFLADASHELRTPVAAIGGFADLYRHDAIPDGELDEVMRRIGQESARMRELVENMLLLARLDEGRPFTPATVDLVALSSDAALDASATHPSRSVTVTGGGHADVSGDESQLRELLANLVANALSYTTGSVELHVESSGDGVTLSVRDEGPGLAADDAERVFDRFWRGPSARRTRGTGLGMPIVRGIVETHGGSLRFVSSAEAGTTVTAVFPPVLPSGQQTGR